MIEKLKIGTRGSPLALKQTEMVVEALKSAFPGLVTEIVTIKTSGDWKPEDGETPLKQDKGGKGLFAKEIENAILAGAVDCGVHSAKDMPAFLPHGLAMEHYLKRADARDAFLCQGCTSFEDLKQGAVIGTCSPRRTAIVLNRRPDAQIEPMRGNVHTRIMKLCSGKVDVTLLAMAGLERLGLHKGVEHGTVTPIAPEEMLPACGQGAIGIETAQGREDIRVMLNKIACTDTGVCVGAERRVLQILNGSCHTPIAAYAVMEGEQIYLRALVASPDGREIYKEEARGAKADSAALAEQVGRALTSKTPKNILG